MRLDLETGTLNYTDLETSERTIVSRVVPSLNVLLKPGRPIRDWDWKYDPEISEDAMSRARSTWNSEFRILSQDQSKVSQLTVNIYRTQKPELFEALEGEQARGDLQWFCE
jgi:hypothetical protein